MQQNFPSMKKNIGLLHSQGYMWSYVHDQKNLTFIIVKGECV